MKIYKFAQGKKNKCLNAKAVPFALSGVNPQTPKKSVIVNRYPLLSLRSGGRLTHSPPCCMLAMLKGIGVATA